MGEKPTYSDAHLRRAIQAAASLAEVARSLGMSVTCTRGHAKRLGARTRFRLGRERLPEPFTINAVLEECRTVRASARRLGVPPEVLREAMTRHGLEAPYKVRAGLPEDEALHRELVAATSLADLAHRWGVEVHTVRNQCKRLGVPVPTRREAARAAGWNPSYQRPAANKAYGYGAVAKALELRAEGLSAPEIAREIGVHQDTVRTWLPDGPTPQILARRVRVREVRKQGLGIRATAREAGCSTNFVERWGRPRPILEERAEASA